MVSIDIQSCIALCYNNSFLLFIHQTAIPLFAIYVIAILGAAIVVLAVGFLVLLMCLCKRYGCIRLISATCKIHSEICPHAGVGVIKLAVNCQKTFQVHVCAALYFILSIIICNKQVASFPGSTAQFFFAESKIYVRKIAGSRAWEQG